MKRKLLGVLLALAIAVVPLAACNKNDDDVTGGDTGKIRFWAYGDITAKNAYQAMVDAYNDGQGKKDGVSVSFSNKAEDGWINLIEQNATSKTGPDVFFAWDRLFKKWTAANITTNLTDYVKESTEDGSLDLDEIWPSTVERFRYDKELNMSGPNEDVYGLPIDTSPTALYYNKTALEACGIDVISVDAEDMDAWNKGEIADRNGVMKSSLSRIASINVPAKGFFRNDANTRKTYGKEGVDISEAMKAAVTLPASGTAMVFNDRIPMNWDEIEDIGWIMSKSKGNNSASTNKGYYTEWWFNYGWAVGGDCVVDLSGNGSWAYSHGDRSANYIVNAGKTFTGAITGTVYQPGETLEFLDKIECEVGDVLTPDDHGGYLKNGSAFGPATDGTTNDSITRQAVKDAVEDGTLTELPSIREAFMRFCNLAGSQGTNLNICPYPDEFNGTNSIQYFTSGKVAFIVERGFNIPVVEEYTENKFEWACAPLPVFKVYTEPSADLKAQYGDKADAYNTEVAKEGKSVGHSESTALCIRSVSKLKGASWKFIRWMIGPEAQAIKASYGFIPNQVDGVQGFYDTLDPDGKKNAEVFVDAAQFETPGDWWYMVNRDWIDIWASPLNNNVRNGRLTMDEYFNTYIQQGNSEVASYGNWDGDLGKVTAGKR